MSEEIIKIDDLRVIYNQGKPNEVRSLDGINLEIFPREYVIIFGPSGCGKSTLLYGMSGLQAPTFGEVSVFGKNLAQMSNKERTDFHQRGIGMVFQAFYLIDSLTVLDNVCLPKVFRGEGLTERRETAMKLLRRFGIAEQADKFPSQLSGGQKQRVSIARALVNDPAIILADEPVGNLDSESAQNVLDIFKEINDIDKKTVILVTHNPEHLVYADRIIYMKDGKVISEDIIRDKRSKQAIKDANEIKPEQVTSELRLLMRTFKNLSLQQVGVLLIPFKAKQLLSHVISELTEEQVKSGENLLAEYLFNNIDTGGLTSRLDLNMDRGGAGWNKTRAQSFTEQVTEILSQAASLQSNTDDGILSLRNYLNKKYNLTLTPEMMERFTTFLRLRVEYKIDRFGIEQRLDASKILGGLGLYRSTAEKIAREVELIMLLKYSG